MANMETLCARYGSKIVEDKAQVKDEKRLETIVRNALGILREEGIFAFYIFLQYRGDKNGKDEGGKLIWSQVSALWRDKKAGPLVSGGGDVSRDQVIAVTEDLQTLLLARQVTERMLVYALYGLRVKDKEQ